MTQIATLEKPTQVETTPESPIDEAEQKRLGVLSDIGRRKLGTLAKIQELTLKRAEKQAEQRKTANYEDRIHESMDLQTQVGQIEAEIRRLTHLVLPSFEREHELVRSGGHPALASEVVHAQMTAGRRQTAELEASNAAYRGIFTKEIVEIAQRSVAAHQAMLITPPDLAVMIASQTPVN